MTNRQHDFRDNNFEFKIKHIFDGNISIKVSGQSIGKGTKRLTFSAPSQIDN